MNSTGILGNGAFITAPFSSLIGSPFVSNARRPARNSIETPGLFIYVVVKGVPIRSGWDQKNDLSVWLAGFLIALLGPNARLLASIWRIAEYRLASPILLAPIVLFGEIALALVVRVGRRRVKCEVIPGVKLLEECLRRLPIVFVAAEQNFCVLLPVAASSLVCVYLPADK